MAHNDMTDVRRYSFGGIADEYDRFRPGPPDEAVAWLVPATATDILEIGAGTGALTRRLVERGTGAHAHVHVRAVEPDARMRAVLAARAPAAEVVDGRAEELPAADASVDVVIGSSMWHWVDAERALPEVARVLRPGGTFSLLWNGPDRSIDWMRSLWSGGTELSADQIEEVDVRRHERHLVHLGAESPFAAPERTVVRWSQAMSADELVGLAGTYSAIVTMTEAERGAYFESMSRFLATHVVPVNDDGKIDVPMRCLCWRTSLR